MENNSDRGFVSGFIGVGIHMTIQHILQDIHIANCCKKELADLKELVMSIELTIMHIQQNRMAFKSGEDKDTSSAVNRWLNDLDGLLLKASKMVQPCLIPAKSLVNFSVRQSKFFSVRQSKKRICYSIKAIREHLKLSPLVVRIPEDQMEDTQKVLEGLGKTKDSLEPLASSATTSQEAMKNWVVGQNQAFQSLQRLVIENVEAKNIGVLGKSGSGKTLHLRTLFNSQEVRDHFKGGLLLWLTVPQRLSITDLCQQIATQKGIDLKKENKEVDEKEWVSHQLEQSNRIALFLDDVCEGNGTELLGIGQIVRKRPNSKVIVSSRDRTALSNMEVLDNYTVTIEDFWNFRGKNNLIEETDMVELDNTFANLERFVIDDHVEARKIVGVVGKHGSAKSLLKTLFNRQKVRTHFRNGLLLWLSLSQSPPVTSVVNDLCQQIARQQNENLDLIAMDEEQKKRWLNDRLQQSSRFALFLDDVWKTDAGRLFEELGIVGAAIDPIKSKVIVSSTDLTALSEVGVAENYTITIQDFDQAESWTLLRDHAKFPYNIGNLPIKSPLEKPVCAGLPQAIKVVGRAMAASTHPQQWEWALDRLQNAQSLDDCLRLSLDALGNEDVNMQLCFQHVAAAFPQDAIIEAQEVIPLWMGEGLLARKMLQHVPHHILADHCLIEPMIRNTEGRPVCLRMQDPFQIGRLYLDLLAERCLIQPTARDADGLVLCFRILNVVRDWAIPIAQDEENFYCCVGNGNGTGLNPLQNDNASSKIKRILLSGNELSSLQRYSSYSDMRSLLISQDTGLPKIPMKLIGNMRSLKVLDLSGTPTSSLPKQVRYLKDLICLKLSGTQIKELPKSVTGLGHLEILDVSFTDIKELPSDIQKLRSLRYLGLRGCKKMQNLPCSISGLLSLQYLYMDGCGMWRKPSSNSCKNVMDGCRKVASFQSLRDLIQLKQLALQSDWEQLEHLDLQNDRLALQNGDLEKLGRSALLKSMTEMDTLVLVLPEMVSLPLHISDMSKLRSLSLKCSKLIKMDSFICSSLTETTFPMKNDVTHLKHLSYLKFYECSVLKDFQHLHKLPYLRQLEIILCPEVENFREFGVKEGFPSLKTFSLVGLPKLQELPEIEGGAMPSLEIFTVMDCPLLRMPQSYLNLGTKIRVYLCPNVEAEHMGPNVEAEHMGMVQQVPPQPQSTKSIIEEYLRQHREKEKWLYGECWCNELFQSITDMRTLRG